jgi:hypothetical protein
MRHNLKELWEAYKADFPDDPTLKRHDKTISGLDKFEDIRYPDANQHAMGVTLGWCGPAGEVTTYGRMKTPKRYTLLVRLTDRNQSRFLAGSLMECPLRPSLIDYDRSPIYACQWT